MYKILTGINRLTLTFTLIAIPTLSQTKEFFCQDNSTQEWVHVISNPERSSIRYGKMDMELFKVKLDREIIQQVGRDRFFLSTGKLGLGESIGQVYGRFGKGRGLFDIYQFGMAGDIESSSNNYDCQEK